MFLYLLFVVCFLEFCLQLKYLDKTIHKKDNNAWNSYIGLTIFAVISHILALIIAQSIGTADSCDFLSFIIYGSLSFIRNLVFFIIGIVKKYNSEKDTYKINGQFFKTGFITIATIIIIINVLPMIYINTVIIPKVKSNVSLYLKEKYPNENFEIISIEHETGEPNGVCDSYKGYKVIVSPQNSNEIYEVVAYKSNNYNKSDFWDNYSK